MENKALDVAVEALTEKGAENIVGLNMMGKSSLFDYVLICSADNERKMKAIAKEIKNVAREQGIDIKRIEGTEANDWLLVDLGDVIAHIFSPDEREKYGLEKYWGDIPRLELEKEIN